MRTLLLILAGLGVAAVARPSDGGPTPVSAPAGAAATPAAAAPVNGGAAPTRLRLRLRPLPAGVREVWLETDADGRQWYAMELAAGGWERVSPDRFSARLAADSRDRTLLYRFFNITSMAGVAWVALGLAGQVLFAGRMVVQWLVSERSKRSVIPTAFWWMSLGGATILLTYFVWRRDIVGVLGQSMGWLIYGRNLWLIHRGPQVPTRLEVGAGS